MEPSLEHSLSSGATGIELAVLDAPILARGSLTQFLLHLAAEGAFDPVWSDQIHADWARILPRTHPALPIETMRQRKAELDRAFPAASVPAGRDALDEVLVNCTTAEERKAAHVLATALSARAAVIVSDDGFCLRDVMKKLWHDIAVLSPDAWCLELLERQTAAVLAGVEAHRVSLAVTPGAWRDALRGMGLPRTADALAGSGAAP